MKELEAYYESYDEEGRLLSQTGQVEYRTTQTYIHRAIRELNAWKILEVGAGTGRYSVALAKEGYQVTAIELVEHNLSLLKAKLTGKEDLTALQGNALDLSALADNSFDLTLLLGPLYHLYTREDKLRALREAIRVTRSGGYIFVAYCMNDPTVVRYVFGEGLLDEIQNAHRLTDTWQCISEPKDLFSLVRTEDIHELADAVADEAEEVKLIATDGASKYMSDIVDAMDQKTYEQWIAYHLTICERQDLIGASHHTLDILRKR